MKQAILFSTPLWVYPKPLPQGAREWAFKYQKENPNSNKLSNRGGYQSHQKPWEEFKYSNHVNQIISTGLPSSEEFWVTGWWLNINSKGDYNLPHSHPGSDLSGIWYITDNEGLLYFQDPSMHTRQILYARMFSKWGEASSKNMNCSAGTLLLFPSDLNHRVEEHILDTPRISVSFNMIGKY